MTLSLNNARKSYTGDGSTTAFTGPACIDATHLEVKLLDLDTEVMGAALTINTHYTVTGANTFSSGQNRAATTVTMMTAPTVDQELYIDLIPPPTQDLAYPEAGSFPALSHATALDRITMQLQAISLYLRKVMTFPDGIDLDFELPVPSARRGKALVFDDDTTAAPNVADLTVSSFYFSSGAPDNGDGANGDVNFDETTWDVYEKVAGAWSLVGTISGQTGAAGATWLSGSGAPSDGSGANGDFYFRTATSDVYTKSGGTWGSPIANLQGASGAGTGDVVGPAGVTDGRFALFDGGTGKLIKQHTGAPGALAVLNTVAAGQIDAGAVTFAKLSDVATATQIRNNTADKIITTDDAWSAAEPVAVSYSGSWAPDLNAGNVQEMTLTGNLTMGAPTNAKAGQPVVIFLIQDGTGSRTISIPSSFDLGSFTPSTAAGAIDMIVGVVRDTSPLQIIGSYLTAR